MGNDYAGKNSKEQGQTTFCDFIEPDYFNEKNWRDTESLSELNTTYVDKYTTEEQKQRDVLVTTLLEHYVGTYKNKVESNRMYKRWLFWSCIISVLAFVIIFALMMLKVNLICVVSVTSVVQLISVCITFLSLIIGILTIITKYVFPEHEEEYITRIVEAIQRNDLENKKENIRVEKEKEQ